MNQSIEISPGETTILFVDDEPLVLESLRLAFRDYDVRTAENGAEALTVLEQNDIAVLVSDQRMPGMQGIELLRQAKLLSPDTIRILMTGYSDLEAIIDSINTGEVFRYIAKPWQNEKLRETIRFAASVAAKQTRLRGEWKSLAETVTKNHHAPEDRKVLFVDRNQMHLKGFKDLVSAKYETFTAESLEEAYSTLRTHCIAVVSCDASLNSVDGMDFLTVVKEKNPDAVTILMADAKDAAVAVRLINEGQVYRYLVKPFPRESLMATMDAAVMRYDEQLQKPHLNLKRQEVGALTGGEAEAPSLSQLLADVRRRLSEKQIY